MTSRNSKQSRFKAILNQLHNKQGVINGGALT